MVTFGVKFIDYSKPHGTVVLAAGRYRFKPSLSPHAIFWPLFVVWLVLKALASG